MIHFFYDLPNAVDRTALLRDVRKYARHRRKRSGVFLLFVATFSMLFMQGTSDL